MERRRNCRRNLLRLLNNKDSFRKLLLLLQIKVKNRHLDFYEFYCILCSERSSEIALSPEIYGMSTWIVIQHLCENSPNKKPETGLIIGFRLSILGLVSFPLYKASFQLSEVNSMNLFLSLLTRAKSISSALLFSSKSF
jgi:hypothetical protein